MIEPERLTANLPELDHADDPRGGAAAWALLMTGATLIFGSISAVIWAW